MSNIVTPLEIKATRIAKKKISKVREVRTQVLLGLILCVLISSPWRCPLALLPASCRMKVWQNKGIDGTRVKARMCGEGGGII